jgi:AraC family transcriptional regulator, regulatory protein of adaptative response / methylated-DNA-[protein]-cysteine methyltransferase
VADVPRDVGIVPAKAAPGSLPSPAAGYAVRSGPWGPVHVAATSRGIVALATHAPTDAFITQLEGRLHGEILPAGDPRLAPAVRAHLDAALAALDRFLGGELDALDALPIDLADRPVWDRAVLEAVRAIRPGTTASYGDVARAIGRPGAARAVGGAVGRNPIGLAIPCHRVIAGDGTLGGYGSDWWGSRESLLAIKRDLLAREGVTVRDRPSEARSGR